MTYIVILKQTFIEEINVLFFHLGFHILVQSALFIDARTLLARSSPFKFRLRGNKVLNFKAK